MGIKLAFVWEDDWVKKGYTVRNALRRFINSNGLDLDPTLMRLESMFDAEPDYSQIIVFEVGLFAVPDKTRPSIGNGLPMLHANDKLLPLYDLNAKTARACQ